MIVKDGEGVSRFIDLQVTGARTEREARLAARAIANSILVKCAWFGGDPNWGRIMDAIGYSGARIREERIRIAYDGLPAVEGGMPARTTPCPAADSGAEEGIHHHRGSGHGKRQLPNLDDRPDDEIRGI